MKGLLQAAVQLQSFFLNYDWPFCFIGGLAVLRWGEPRLTQDVNGRADALVTFNVRDFGTVPLQFGVEVLLPREAIARIKQ